MDLTPEFTDTSTNSTSTMHNTTVPEDPGVTLNHPPPNGHSQHSSTLDSSQHQHQPPRQHQHQHEHPSNTAHPLDPNISMAPPSLEDMVPDPYIDLAFPGRGEHPPAGIVTPLDSTESEGSVPLPSGWDFTPAHDVPRMTTPGMDSFNDAQWAQLLASGNWDAWRNHG